MKLSVLLCVFSVVLCVIISQRNTEKAQRSTEGKITAQNNQAKKYLHP